MSLHLDWSPNGFLGAKVAGASCSRDLRIDVDVLDDADVGQTRGGIAHTFYAVAGNLGQALRKREGFDTGDESQVAWERGIGLCHVGCGYWSSRAAGALRRSISFGEFGSRSLN